MIRDVFLCGAGCCGVTSFPRRGLQPAIDLDVPSLQAVMCVLSLAFWAGDASCCLLEPGEEHRQNEGCQRLNWSLRISPQLVSVFGSFSTVVVPSGLKDWYEKRVFHRSESQLILFCVLEETLRYSVGRKQMKLGKEKAKKEITGLSRNYSEEAADFSDQSMKSFAPCSPV